MDIVTNRAPAREEDRRAWAEAGMEDLGGGLYRIPLPLPGDALTAVNVYALTGDHGVDLIDSGMGIAQARDELSAALSKLGYGLPDIRNFFITHIHEDHYTLAIMLRTTLRNQVSLGEGERANLKAILDATLGRPASTSFRTMMPALGAETLAVALTELNAARRNDPSRPQLEWAEPDRWLTDGTLLELPGRTLRTIDTPGHTAGHVVFHDEAGAMLFAGDHVLPHITPSIGFQPADSRLALEDYLNSLRLMLTLPDSRLLPAHGPVRESTHARVNELLEHHDVRLAQTLEAASPGKVSAFEVAQALPWTRRQRKLADLDPMNQMLATGETAAHLEVLLLRGQLVRELSPDGIELYSLAAQPAAPATEAGAPVG